MTTPAATESLLTFPCSFPIKVMGLTQDGFAQAIVVVVKKHVPDYDASTLEMRASRAGKYLSLTCTVKLNVPCSVAVPERVVDGVALALNVNPAGSAPETTVHAYPAPVPPEAVIVASYGSPSTAFGSVAPKISNDSCDCPSTLTVNARVAVPPTLSVTCTVKPNVPPTVGVPAMVVSGVPLEAMLSPAGSAPDTMRHV